ncbi:helix-turn-helix transcriptional regulator [bacterium]|nr:helix-turn-helix transcriptional regulator [bacterium]
MQYKNEKTLQLVKVLGQIIQQNRVNRDKKSLNTFAYEYDLSPGNLSRIENGQIEAKITMLWRIAEALNMPLSTIFKQLEDTLGKDFYISDK